MKQQFKEIKFGAAKLAMIDQLNQIVDEYQSKRLILTVRQLYYQMVSRDLIENTVRSYKNLAALISDARLAGLIDWSMIQDRGRGTSIPQHWKNPGQIVQAAANGYRIDHWLGQPYHVEVMVEKDALSGVLGPVCSDLDVGFSANKGYSSSSALFEVGLRLSRRNLGLGERAGDRDVAKQIVILYFGDHDPSGIDMTRDIADRLAMFSGVTLETERLALNMDQIERWNPPPNPAKETDSRAKGYIKKFGSSSWELDAIEPLTLAGIVRSAILEYRDEEIYNAVIKRETAERKKLLKLAQHFFDDEPTHPIHQNDEPDANDWDDEDDREDPEED